EPIAGGLTSTGSPYFDILERNACGRIDHPIRRRQHANAPANAGIPPEADPCTVVGLCDGTEIASGRGEAVAERSRNPAYTHASISVGDVAFNADHPFRQHLPIVAKVAASPDTRAKKR